MYEGMETIGVRWASVIFREIAYHIWFVISHDGAERAAGALMFHEIVPRNSGVAPAGEAAPKALHRDSGAARLKARPDTNRDVRPYGTRRGEIG
jgi:hypothetical protein